MKLCFSLSLFPLHFRVWSLFFALMLCLSSCFSSEIYAQGQNQAKGVNQNIILSQEPRIKGFLKLADGGRVNKAMGGGASETPAEPVATNLTFEQLRTRLPKEITDDIVKLVATSEEALQDFAYIRTQGDVEKFNVKYGVNLVLPQDTA